MSTGLVLSGIAFGSALTLAGVASPQVIRDQFTLSDYHMLVTLLTASASSAAIIRIYNSRAGDKAIPPRAVQGRTGWLKGYESHIVGGAMVGLGMGLTGACPGTVLVQVAAGVGRSRAILAGGVLAGAVFSRWRKSLSSKEGAQDQGVRHSVMSVTGWSANEAVLIYNAMLLVMIRAVLIWAPRSRGFVHPVTGGLLIALGQLASLTLAGKTIGVSAAYEASGKALLDLVGGRGVKELDSNVAFALAILVGAKAIMLAIPGTVEQLVPLKEQSLPVALVGGFLLAFGSRLAGGCTSGHGISGMAGMSLGSFVTVAAMFATAIVSCLPLM